MNAFQIRQLINALEAIEQQELAKEETKLGPKVSGVVPGYYQPIISQEPNMEPGEIEVDEAGRRRKLLSKWGLA